LAKKGFVIIVNTREIGNKYEDKSVETLVKEEYKILERNYQNRFGEIDIIAEKNKEIVFIEVKYRKTNKFESIEDIKNVNGIGDKIFENLKGDISTSGTSVIPAGDKVSKKAKEVNDMTDKVKQGKNEVAKKTKDIEDKISTPAKDIDKSKTDIEEKASKSIKNKVKSGEDKIEKGIDEAKTKAKSLKKKGEESVGNEAEAKKTAKKKSE